jgi:hypothetical protein
MGEAVGSTPTTRSVERVSTIPGTEIFQAETGREFRTISRAETTTQILLSRKTPLLAGFFAFSSFVDRKQRLGGGRDRDRTCDPLHVKEVLFR